MIYGCKVPWKCRRVVGAVSEVKVLVYINCKLTHYLQTVPISSSCSFNLQDVLALSAYCMLTQDSSWKIATWVFLTLCCSYGNYVNGWCL